MEKLSKENNKATYEDFIRNLQQEFKFHQEGKPSNHRYKLIKLALNSIQNSDLKLTVSDFVDVTKLAKAAITIELHQINEIGRLEEVMETLRVVAIHTTSIANRSKEATVHVESVLRNIKNDEKTKRIT